MVSRRGGGEYEESRAERIKENMERMKSLGIADLSKQLKPLRPSRKPKPAPSHAPPPPRRSSRLKDLPQVTYTEKKPSIKEQSSFNNKKKVEIRIQPGQNPEIYTDEHEKLLGDSEAAWTLLVDGYDEDGLRIYDSVEGKSCHQCRQKTLGLHTKCSKCNAVSGQFCGDCLYMRYGENVTEVNVKQDWVCPVCRGICNCSRCRRDKGWNPTGAIYRKVQKLGFKSVAHYLIHTRREGAIVTESPSTGDDEKEGSKQHETAEDSESEYEGDGDDDDDNDNDE